MYHRLIVLVAALATGEQGLATKSKTSHPPAPSGPVWEAWQDSIRRHFAHSRVTFSGAPGIRPLERTNGCPPPPTTAPGLRAEIRSREPTVFGDIDIVIHPLAPGIDAYAYLRESVQARLPENSADFWPGPGTCLDVGAMSFVQFDGFLIEISGHCYDGALYDYEVGALLEMLRSRDPAKVPQTFALGHCGFAPPEFNDVAAFLQSLSKRRSFWGHLFPDIRTSERKRLANDPTWKGPSRFGRPTRR